MLLQGGSRASYATMSTLTRARAPLHPYLLLKLMELCDTVTQRERT